MEVASETSLRKALAKKQAAIDALANAVRELKAASASKDAISEAVDALNSLKIDKSSAEKELLAAIAGNGNGACAPETRETFRLALKRRLFYIPSFKIYGGVVRH